jgi:monofunctional glycosyltransferase
MRQPRRFAVETASSAAVALPAPSIPAPARRAPVEQPGYLRRAARFIFMLLLGLAGFGLVLIVLYRWIDPPTSALMLGQRLSGEVITQRWVPLERISPNLQLATIMSEDGKFCRHHGVDWAELNEAIENARDGIPRGGSTITMQVVKNLFLWPSKSYVRKAIEIALTYVVEAAWSKRRILEIYLNIAEWGPGVFGAEAASRYHFRKPASALSPREAALLAVSLPNPFERQAGTPGPGTLRLADNLLARMRTASTNAFCVRER